MTEDERKALDGKAFKFLGTQARISHRMIELLEERGPQGMAESLQKLEFLPTLRDDLEAAAQGLRWAAELCEAGRDIVDSALAAND